MHQYTCKECKPFYTHFEPQFDEKFIFCPCCGQDDTCEYVGETVVDAVYTPDQRSVNDARIEAIKVELEFIKGKKEALNELISALITTSTNPMVSVLDVQEKYSKQQDALFAEWKKLSEENYLSFQKWFDGLQMGVK